MVMQNPKRDLEGKVAIVTGATSGIGLAVAKELIARGAHVTLNGIFFDNPSKSAELQEQEFRDTVLSELKHSAAKFSTTQQVKLVCADVSKPEAAQEIVGVASEHGHIDIVVNSAGIHPPEVQKPFEQVDLEKAKKLMDVNFWGVWNVSQAAMPWLKQSKEGATLLNISSVHGIVGSPERAIYVSAKHALEGLTKTLNGELRLAGKKQCRLEDTQHKAYTICPAFVKTALALRPVENRAREFAEKNSIPYEEAFALAEGWRLQHQEGKWIEENDIARACADISVGKKEISYGEGEHAYTVPVEPGKPVIMDNGYTKPPHAQEEVVAFVPFDEFVRQEGGKVKPGMCDEGHGAHCDYGQPAPANEIEGGDNAHLEFLLAEYRAGRINL